MCRLTSAGRSRSVPDDIVRVSYLDLSVTFCLFTEDPERRTRGVRRISGEDLGRWKIGKERLIRDAYENTAGRYRYLLCRLADLTAAIERDAVRFLLDPMSVIGEIPEVREEDRAGEKKEPYTLLNHELFNGSVILLYPDRLAVFADRLKTDLILLPSSVNELICLGWSEEIDCEKLRKIVRSINRTCVSDEDFLSDSLYRYCREKNCVEVIPAHSAAGRRVKEQE